MAGRLPAFRRDYGGAMPQTKGAPTPTSGTLRIRHAFAIGLIANFSLHVLTGFAAVAVHYAALYGLLRRRIDALHAVVLARVRAVARPHDRWQALCRRASGAGARQHVAARAPARHRPLRVAGANRDDHSSHVRQLRSLPAVGLPLAASPNVPFALSLIAGRAGKAWIRRWSRPLMLRQARHERTFARSP